MTVLSIRLSIAQGILGDDEFLNIRGSLPDLVRLGVAQITFHGKLQRGPKNLAVCRRTPLVDRNSYQPISFRKCSIFPRINPNCIKNVSISGWPRSRRVKIVLMPWSSADAA